jgi:hypothetical protein
VPEISPIHRKSHYAVLMPAAVVALLPGVALVVIGFRIRRY